MIPYKNKKKKKNHKLINIYTKSKNKKVDYYIALIHIQKKLRKKCCYEV